MISSQDACGSLVDRTVGKRVVYLCKFVAQKENKSLSVYNSISRSYYYYYWIDKFSWRK